MVYLVHHGDALGPEVDPQRPLSRLGVDTATRLATQAAARGAKPVVVWHSGKLRARQTAEIFWRACNPLATLAAARGLQPGDPPAAIRDTIAGDSRELMLVGHLPHLPALLGLLLAGDAEAAVDFPLHGVVALEQAGGQWVERWRLEAR